MCDEFNNLSGLLNQNYKDKNNYILLQYCGKNMFQLSIYILGFVDSC